MSPSVPCHMLTVGRLHAECEAAGDLDGTLATLVAEPVYLFPTLRACLLGGDRIRRYYEHFFRHFQPRIRGYRALEEWVGPWSLAQEYALRLDDDTGERVMLGVLYADPAGDGSLLTGERIYADEALLRDLLGPLFRELETLE